MISILPEKDNKIIVKYYNNAEICFDKYSNLIIATENGKEIGYCLFKVEKSIITVLKIIPEDNLMLFDGILRSALHVGITNGCKSAYYSNTVNEGNIKKLGFAVSSEDKELDINKLFMPCCCENNKKS